MSHPPKVLLVEDDANDLDLTLRVLRSCGLADNVSIAHDGREAIDTIMECASSDDEAMQLPDLIILDLRLPKIGGIEVLQWLRADKRTQDIPVVVLTGSRDDKSVIDVHRLGVLGYLVKPITSKDFVRTVAGTVFLAPPAVP